MEFSASALMIRRILTSVLGMDKSTVHHHGVRTAYRRIQSGVMESQVDPHIVTISKLAYATRFGGHLDCLYAESCRNKVV